MAPPTEAECLCIPQPAFKENLPNITRNSLSAKNFGEKFGENLCEKFNELKVGEKIGEKSEEKEKNSCKNFGHQHGQWHQPKDFFQMNRIKSMTLGTNSLELLGR